MKESTVLSACLNWLNVHGYFVWRNNTGAIATERRFFRYGHPGSADILGILPDGRFLAVECKRPLGPRGGDGGSRQTDEQIKFQRAVESNNGVYLLVRSLDDLIDGMKQKGGSK